MRSVYTIDLEDAMRAVEAGVEEARRQEVRVAVCVVDASGFPVAIARMDGASGATVQFATEKARAAAWTGVETSALDELVAQRPAFSTTGMCMVEGGVPVIYRDQVIGAIATSGAQADQDARISGIALAVLDCS